MKTVWALCVASLTLTLSVSAQQERPLRPCSLPPTPASAYLAAPTKWPGGIVYYEFDANVSAEQQALMHAAMDEWQFSGADVSFQPRMNQGNFIHILDSNENSSAVGMTGVSQDLKIYNWTFEFVMAHELCHALGFWHEQSRWDRDTFVTILDGSNGNPNHIESGKEHNFDLLPESAWLTTTASYDCDSVMHYDQCAFTTCASCVLGCETILVLPPNENWQGLIGQRSHLSVNDIQDMKAAYGSAQVASFGGTVTDSLTAMPITTASVTWGGLNTTTNGSGSYSFSSVPCQASMLQVTKSGYQSVVQSYSPTCNDSSVKDVSLFPVSQEAMLTALDASAGDQFGSSVALMGDTILVGASYDNGASGAVYVFVRSGTSWIQQAKLVASDGGGDNLFGSSVALSGDTAVVGAVFNSPGGKARAGAAYVFVRSGTTWTEQAKLTAADGMPFDFFGGRVSVAGETALIGANHDDHAGGTDSGSAYVFIRAGTSWNQQAKLVAAGAEADDRFGQSVGLFGDTAVVGAPYVDQVLGDNNTGAVYVFIRSGASWSQQAMLTASDAAANDELGDAVALDGNTVVVGAYSDDLVGAMNAGSAYVFVRSGISWLQQAKLVGTGGTTGDQFGNSVAVSGDFIVIGSVTDGAGSAYVFLRDGTSWSQQAYLQSADYLFGYGVGVFGDKAVVGAAGADHSGKNDAGAAYAFYFGSPPWTNLGSGLAGTFGIPSLAGSGSLFTGTAGSLTLSNATPSALSLLFIGLGSTPVPFKCGTLVAFPFAINLTLGTNAAGSIALPWPAWPSGLSGFSLYWQYGVQDAGAICGASLSNALRSDVP